LKWGILAILLLLPLSVHAGEREVTPTECSVIESRAFGFIKCRYRPDSLQWRLSYKPTAYKQVVKSGQYGSMLRTLCDAYGSSIHETNHGFFSGWSREIKCDRSRH
jgi:hypothetical protein